MGADHSVTHAFETESLPCWAQILAGTLQKAKHRAKPLSTFLHAFNVVKVDEKLGHVFELPDLPVGRGFRV
jgi:hypothetical protein